jgi:hypothetical protein
MTPGTGSDWMPASMRASSCLNAASTAAGPLAASALICGRSVSSSLPISALAPAFHSGLMYCAIGRCEIQDMKLFHMVSSP